MQHKGMPLVGNEKATKLIFKFNGSFLWERSLQNKLLIPTFTGGDVYLT